MGGHTRECCVGEAKRPGFFADKLDGRRRFAHLRAKMRAREGGAIHCTVYSIREDQNEKNARVFSHIETTICRRG